ncbi:MAG: hypothetical protein ACLRXQ_01250 [Phascolarctobacterium faecium]
MERIAGFTGANVYKGSELYLSGDGQSIRQYIGGLAAGLRSNLQHTVPGQAGAVLAGMTLGVTTVSARRRGKILLLWDWRICWLYLVRI